MGPRPARRGHKGASAGLGHRRLTGLASPHLTKHRRVRSTASLHTLPFCCCYKLKVCGHPELGSLLAHFPSSVCSFVSPCPISALIIPVMSQTLYYHSCIVTADQWALMLLLWLFRYFQQENVFNGNITSFR